MLNEREIQLLQEAVRRVIARYGSDTRYSGRVTSRGNVVWQAFAYTSTGRRWGFERITDEERQLLNDQTTAEYLALKAEDERRQAYEQEQADSQATVSEHENEPPAAPSEPPELDAYSRHVSEGGQVRYHPVSEGYQGPIYYRTPGGRYLTQREYEEWRARQRERLAKEYERQLSESGESGDDSGEDTSEGAIGGSRGTQKPRRPFADLISRAMQGAVLGGVGASLAGSAVAGLAALVTNALGLALEGAGATGAGVMRIANGLISLFSSSLQLAANVGGAVLGGAIGLMLGGALGAAAGGVAGTIAGALGGIFSNAGRMLGETIGAAGQIMRDTAQTAVNLADNIMRLSLVSGQAVSSVSGLTTTLRLLGMGTGAAESMFGSWGQRIEFLQMRFAALGVEMARNKDGTHDWQRTLLNVHDWLQQFDPMLRQPYARALLGPDADQLMPYLQDRNQLEQAAAAADELAPRAETVKRAWDDLRIPLNEIAVGWDNLKVEFVSGFIPMIAGGIDRLTGLWSAHKDTIIAWFEELPGRTLGFLERVANGLQDLVENVGPTLSALWDGFIGGAKAAWAVLEPIINAIREHPFLTAGIGGAAIGGVRGGPGGAAVGFVQGATTAWGGIGEVQTAAWHARRTREGDAPGWSERIIEAALTWGPLIATTLLSRRFGAAGRAARAARTAGAAARAARTAGAAGEGAEAAAETVAALSSGAQWSGLFRRIGGGIAGGYRRLATMGATRAATTAAGRAMTLEAASGISSNISLAMMTPEMRAIALAARAGRVAPGITPTIGPLAESATTGLSGFLNALRGIGPAARGLAGTVGRLFGAAGPIALAISTAITFWDVGSWVARRLNIGGAGEAAEENARRRESERKFAERKDDARDRGYVLIEDVAESMGLRRKWEQGKLSDEEQAALWNEFRRQRQAVGRPERSIRSEVDPAMNRRWGDWFKDLGDKLQNKDQKPLKVEGEVKIRQEMDVRPNSELNVSIMRNEILQAWRDIQLAVS